MNVHRIYVIHLTYCCEMPNCFTDVSTGKVHFRFKSEAEGPPQVGIVPSIPTGKVYKNRNIGILHLPGKARKLSTRGLGSLEDTCCNA